MLADSRELLPRRADHGEITEQPAGAQVKVSQRDNTSAPSEALGAS